MKALRLMEADRGGRGAACSRWARLGAMMVALVGGVGVNAGCQGVTGAGRSSFEMLGAPAGLVAAGNAGEAVEETGERIDFIPLRANGPLAEPVYPAAAYAAGVGDYSVYVTVAFDERGRVVEVTPSWQRIAVKQAFAELFLEAVRAAVTTWSLSPARQVYYERTAGGEERYGRTEPVAATVEIRFDFEAREGVR